MSRILIADAQPVTRHAIRLLMEEDGHEVVGEADNGPKTLQLARSLRPDLTILELSIPGLGGLEVLQRLIAAEPDARVLVLTTQDSEYFAGRCLQTGAGGFVSKQDDPLNLRRATNAILRGHSYFPDGALTGAAPALVGCQQPSLSAREVSVLQLLARGFSNIAIAEQLAISDKTVSTYKARLLQKLHASSLVELIDIARRNDLLGSSSGDAKAADLDPGQGEQLELLQKMIDAVPGTLAVRDIDGRVMICNQAFLEISGLSSDEVIGSRYADIMTYSLEDARAVQGNYLQAVAQNAPMTFERVFTDKRDGRRVLTLWAKPLHDAGGRLIGMLCGSQNQTERDGLLRELRDTSRRMEAGNRVRDAFIQAMSREVGAVFRGISAMIDLTLSQPRIGDAQREPLKVAHEMTASLSSVFADLQDFGLLQAGRLTLDPQPHDLRELAESCIAGQRGQAQARGLALELQCGRLQEPRVWVDAGRLRQVLDNLLGNAVKFTDDGGVLMRLSAVAGGKGQVEVMLAVEDSGPGIDDGELERLFEPFRQLPDAGHILRGGSGLGLTLCRMLLELMHGSIELKSHPGAGTQALVRLSLPVAEG
nr:ATP-binding protein [uncultured Pseudomonas sp.]